jgi:GrpB-like predicted nucleotidyltransferase (UPF0157 family)
MRATQTLRATHTICALPVYANVLAHFRDYLITHPETAAEYAVLKTRLHKDFEHNRDGYTAAKTDFIRAVMARARNQ